MLDTGARARLAATRFEDVTWLAEVGSTNDEVATRARAGAPEGVVVVADVQRAGRGRRGRTWEARPGSSLLVSVLLRPPAPHLAAIAGGLAALDAVGLDGASLKWPNDLVVEGRGKLAGILAEGVGGGRGMVVVGLGLNVDWGDAPLPPGGTCLGPGFDRAELLADYLIALERWCRATPDALLGAYRAACSTIGRRVRVELPGGRRLAGRAESVDDDGRLVVDGRPVAAGDVVHLR